MSHLKQHQEKCLSTLVHALQLCTDDSLERKNTDVRRVYLFSKYRLIVSSVLMTTLPRHFPGMCFNKCYLCTAIIFGLNMHTSWACYFFFWTWTHKSGWLHVHKLVHLNAWRFYCNFSYIAWNSKIWPNQFAEHVVSYLRLMVCWFSLSPSFLFFSSLLCSPLLCLPNNLNWHDCAGHRCSNFCITNPNSSFKILWWYDKHQITL